MKYFSAGFVLFSALSAVLGAEQPGKAPQNFHANKPEAPLVIQDTGKNKKEDFAGTWVAYRMYYGYPSAKLDTRFQLTPDGSWMTRNDTSTRKAGTFRMVDDYILLHPLQEDGTAPDTRAIPGKLIDGNSFILAAPGQENRAVLYRRERNIVPLHAEELVGTWRFYDVDPVTGKKRPSPFTLEFQPSAKYEFHADSKTFRIPGGAEKGGFEIKQDMVILKNTCKENGPWKEMRFFKLFDNLILNQPDGGYVFGEKQ